MSSTSWTLQSVMYQASSELASLGSWWLHEVRETWTELMERFVPHRARRFVVEIEKHQGVVRQIGSTAAGTVVHWFSPDEMGKPPALNAFWSEGAPAGARALVMLPESSVLICSLQLPPIHDRDVNRVIDLQLERELPLPREQLHVDWEVEKHADQSRTVTVAIARRSDVEKICDAVRSWGWSIIAVGMKMDGDRPRFNMLTRNARSHDFTLGRREGWLICSAAILCLTYCATVAGHWWYERSSLAAPLAQARADVADIQKRQSELAALSKPIVALRHSMQAPSAMEALLAMTTAIPADTWVYQAEIRAPASEAAVIKLEAYTPAADSFVGSLQQSNQFEQVRLLQTTSAGTEVQRDRVELTVQLRGTRL